MLHLSPLPSALAKRYEIVRLLGRGGMGEVIAARDRLLDQPVALKRVRAGRGPGRGRLREEFSVLVDLEHPGIVRVRELSLSDGEVILVTDRIDGPRLDTWLALGPESEAVRDLLAAALRVLGWLHRQGVVHGDLKPSNVLVVEEGERARPVLIDFGLAQCLTEDGRGPERIGGTRAFLAPELRQHQELAPSPSTDLYALGVCFAGHLDHPVVGMMKHRDPEERPKHAEAALALLTGQTQAAPPARRRPRWAEAACRIAEAVAERGLLHSVAVPARAQARPLLHTLKLELEQRGVPALLLPEHGLAAPGSRLWRSVLACLGLSSAEPGGKRIDDLDQAALPVLDAFRSAADPPVLLAPTPERWPALARGILRRLIASGAPVRIVVARSEGAPAFEGELESHVAASPPAPGSDPPGADPFDAPLDSELQGVVDALWWLGARAGRPELRAAVGARLAPELDRRIDLLCERGWISTPEPLAVALSAESLSRLEDGRLRAPAAPAGERAESLLAALGRHEGPSPRRRARRAELLEALGRVDEAAACWWTLARDLDSELELGAAGRAALASAAVETGSATERLTRIAWAARWLEAAGMREELGRALEVAAGLAERGGSSEHRARHALIEARTALHLGQPAEAVRWANEAEGFLGDLDRDGGLRLEIRLCRGSAGLQTAELEAARDDLYEAARLAEALEDLHSLGRALNNLGNLWFRRGDWDRAEEAYRRTAAIKESRGDLRGLRIARSNQALALRAAGRSAEALGEASAALRLARRLGDRRGEAVGCIVLALLWLDLGETSCAAGAMAALDDLRPPSAVVRIDARLTRARVAIAERRWAEASSEAEAGARAARAGEHDAAEREACFLGYLAGVLGGEHGGGEAGEPLAWAQRAEAARSGGGSEDRIRMAAAHAHALARAGGSHGSSAEGRAALAEVLGGISQPLGPAARDALPLLDSAAGLLGDVAAAERIRDLVEGSERTRAAELASLPARVEHFGGKTGPEEAGATRPEAAQVRPAGSLLERALLADPAEASGALCRELAAEVVRLREALRQTEAERRRLVETHQEDLAALSEALEQSRSLSELRYDYGRIVHRSPVMRRLLRTLDKVTEAEVPVLLLGESGVGKELLARALHFNGPRSRAPFVAENCGAIPPDLFESTFFGHVRGAFTGATGPRRGLLREAHGGTLFLDELGELRPEHQVKLLRVLQERSFRPVGAGREEKVDLRLVAATNRDLRRLVDEGGFRQDLYYRVAVLSLEVPPLRERPEDLLPLALHFLGGQSERLGRDLRLTPEAAEALQRWSWPGNVRELENEIMRASVLCEDGTVEPRHLSPSLRSSEAAGLSELEQARWDGETPLREMVETLERSLIRQALDRNRGRKAPAARALGLSRPGLDSKLTRLGLEVRRIPAARRKR